MMYVLTPYARTRRPLAGVPWRDLTGSEFDAAIARMDRQFPGQNVDLVALGYFEKFSDKAYKARFRGRLEADTDGDTEEADPAESESVSADTTADIRSDEEVGPNER